MGGAYACHDWTQLLVRSGVLCHGIIAVGIVDRHKNQYLIVQQMLLVTEENVAHGNQRCFLALHFPTVDVALDVDDGFAGCRCCFGTGHRRIRQHHDRHIATLAGEQQRFPVHEFGLPVQGVDNVHHFLEA